MTSQEILTQFGPREAMEYDVVVVGGGPGGLATAIRLKQLAVETFEIAEIMGIECVTPAFFNQCSNFRAFPAHPRRPRFWCPGNQRAPRSPPRIVTQPASN